MYAVEVRLSLVLGVGAAGFMAHRICWGLYPMSLKMVVRNFISWARESSLQRALALCTREARTECLFAGW